MAEVFGSDIALIGAALVGLALTSLGIIRDVDPLHLHQKNQREWMLTGGNRESIGTGRQHGPGPAARLTSVL